MRFTVIVTAGLLGVVLSCLLMGCDNPKARPTSYGKPAHWMDKQVWMDADEAEIRLHNRATTDADGVGDYFTR